MLTLNNKNGIQHSNKNELHFLRGLTFGFVLQAKLCKRCNCSPSVLIFPNFHLNKVSSTCHYRHLDLSSLMKETFFPIYLKILPAYLRVKSFNIKVF